MAPWGAERRLRRALAADDWVTVLNLGRRHGPSLLDLPTGAQSFTPLLTAAFRGHIDAARILLDLGANVRCVTPRSRASCMHAAARGGRGRMCELLVARGAAVDAVDGTGGTALHDAAWRGHTTVVRALLRCGADARARNGAGRLPYELVRGGTGAGAEIRALLRGAMAEGTAVSALEEGEMSETSIVTAAELEDRSSGSSGQSETSAAMGLTGTGVHEGVGGGQGTQVPFMRRSEWVHRSRPEDYAESVVSNRSISVSSVARSETGSVRSCATTLSAVPRQHKKGRRFVALRSHGANAIAPPPLSVLTQCAAGPTGTRGVEKAPQEPALTEARKQLLQVEQITGLPRPQAKEFYGARGPAGTVRARQSCVRFADPTQPVGAVDVSAK